MKAYSCFHLIENFDKYFRTFQTLIADQEEIVLIKRAPYYFIDTYSEYLFIYSGENEHN